MNIDYKNRWNFPTSIDLYQNQFQKGVSSV